MAKRKKNPKLSYNPIPDYSTDWMDDPLNGHKRFSGESVQRFIKDELRGKYGYSRVESGNIQYFHSVEDADAYDEGDTSKLLHQDSLAGTNVEFRFVNQYTGNVFINGNNAYPFPLHVRSMDVNSDGSETPHDVNISLTIQVNLNGSTTTTELGMHPANEDFTVDITPYVADGATFVLVANNETGDRRTSSRYTVVRANLLLGFQTGDWWAKAYRRGDEWSIPLTLDVNVPCELRATIRKDGVNYVTKAVPSSEFSSIYALSVGHPLDYGGTGGVYEIHLEIVPTDESLSGMERPQADFNIFCVDADETGTFFLTNNVAGVLQNYANNKVLEYAVFSGGGNHTVTFASEVEGTPVAAPTTVAAVNGQVGVYYLNIELERLDNADFTTSVTAHIDDGADVLDEDFTTSNSLGYAATPGATHLVKANGRSNGEADRDKFMDMVTGGTIAPEWENVTWSGVDGWCQRTLADRNGDATAQTVFRLLGGASGDIPLTPLAMRANEGRTLEIKFQPRNVRNYDTPVISCFDEYDDRYVGLKITGDRITLLTTNRHDSDTQTVKYDNDEPVHLAIVVNPAYSESGNTFAAIMLFINGQRQRIFAYDRDINVSSTLHVGSADADLDIFDIRTYDTALTCEEIEVNAVNWQASLYDKAYTKARNNIRENGKVSFNKVRSLCNVFVFRSSDGQGRIPALGMSKNDKIHGVLKTYWRDNPEWNREVELDEQGQGTTSMEYFRWNWKGSFSTAFPFDGLHAPIKKICAKKNCASSMQSHKMGGCEAYDYLARATGAVEQDAPRQAIWQYPFVGFAEKTVNGQTVYEFIGLYTIGPDKGDKDTFGFDSDTIALEGLDNEPLSTNFRVPWNDSTVAPDGSGEKYYVCGEKAWEDSMKNPAKVAARWKPAYNLVYECSQLIRPWKGATIGQTAYPATIEGLEDYGEAVGEIDTTTTEGEAQYLEAIRYEYWISGTYELYYFNPAVKAYSRSNTGAPIDLVSQLCGKGYVVGKEQSGGVTTDITLTAEMIDAADDDDERNSLFLKARLSKFRAEFGDYFDVTNAFFHLAWVEFNAATDNLAKNTYPYLRNCSDPASRLRWRQDDVDTVGPIDNQGKDKKPYCVELEDDYESYGLAPRDVWNGRTSQLWYTLKEAFAEEYADFMRTRFIPAMHYGNGTDVMARIKAFFSHFYYDRAQEYFGAALYNADGIYTYDKAYTYSGSYSHKGIALEQSLGDHYSAEKQWFRMRTVYMMSKYCADLFSGGNQTDVFTNRPAAGTNQYTITPAIYMYPVVQNGQQAIQGPRIWPGSNVTSWTTNPITTAGDQAFRINGMSYLRDIGNLYANTLDGPVSVNGSMLQTLLLGNHEDASSVKSTVTAVEIGNATSLRTLDLGNIATLAGSPDLRACANLRSLYANGTSVAMVTLSDGGPLQSLVLGSSITSLQLLGKQMLETLTIGSTDRITQVEMANCNAYTIGRVMSILADIPTSRLTSVRLAFGTQAAPSVLTDTSIQTLLSLNDADIDTKQFSGYVTKASGGISASTYTALEAMNITYVGDVTPEVTVTSRDVAITEGACAIGSGESATFIANVIPPSAGTARFRLYNGTFVIAEDEQGKAVYNGVTLDCATGRVTVGEVAANFTVGITAYAGSVESAKITASIEQIVTIGGISAAAQTYTATGEYEVALTPQNAGYNVPVTSLEVSGDSGVSVVDAATLRLKVTVSAIPSDTEQHTCTVTARDSRGNVFTCQLSYTIEVVRVTSFSISGKENIYSAGNNYYELTDILPANHNKDITRLVATATASEGSFPVTVDGVRGFTVSVVNMPDHNTPLTLRAEATLDNGSSVVATKTVLIKMASNIDILDELGVAIMHVDGSFYTAEEWQANGFTKADANGVAMSDAKTNPSDPHRVVTLNERLSYKWSETNEEVPNVISSNIPSVLLADFDGEGNTNKIISYFGQGSAPLSEACKEITSSDGSSAYLPAAGELYMLLGNETAKSLYKKTFDFDLKKIPPYATSDQNGKTRLVGLYHDGSFDYSKIKDRLINTGGNYNVYIGLPFAKIKAIPLTKPVDLGLPSGIKWANINVGARSPEESGLFFSWGNTDGHDGTDGYAFTSDTYAETEGAAVSGTLPVANDAAAAVLGGGWRTPKVEEMQELIDYCTAVWTAVNNINGVRFTSNVNGNSIFIPAYGLLTGTRQPASGDTVIIPSDSLANDSVKTLYFKNGSSTAVTIGSHVRPYGYTFRPVQLPATPNGVIVSGKAKITSAGGYTYAKAFTTDRYTGSVQSVAWSLQQPSQYASIDSQTNDGATLAVTGVPAEEATVVIQCTVTFDNGETRTGIKTLTLMTPPLYVDFGLPSGLKWAKGNIVADGNGYKVGEETDYGAYVSWGNVEPHFSSNGSTFDDGYDFGIDNNSPYAQTPGAAIPFTSQSKNADYSADGGYDAARELLGGSWRMPTANEFKELYDNTDNQWATIAGVAGRKFMKKSDHSVYVFFPAAGYGSGTSPNYRGTLCRYWSSSLHSAGDGYSLALDVTSVLPQSNYIRHRGFSVRAVQ